MHPPSHTERLHALDALRAVAMLLGVALHAMIAYMSYVWDLWAADDPSSSIVFDVAFWLIHLCRMEIFFVMAGFFGCLLLARYQWRGFLRHRLSRIGLPYLVGMITVVPACHLVWIWGLNQRAVPEDQVPFIFGLIGWYTAQPIYDQLRPWHLWFLQHLIVFYALAILWLAIARWQPLAIIGKGLTEAWAWCVRFGLAAPALLTLTFPLLFMQSGAGVDTQEGPLPPLRILAYYLVFFSAGWMLYRRRDVLPALARTWLWVPLILIGLASGLAAVALLPSVAEHPVLARLFSAVATASLVLGVTGSFLHLFQRPSRVMRYVSDSAYWVYLIHLPLVVAINIIFIPLPIAALPKFALVMLTSTIIMYLSYHVLVRYTWIGTMLNGPRHRPAAAQAAPAPAGSAANDASAAPAPPAPPPGIPASRQP